MTNSIRRGATTSLLVQGEVRNASGTLELACKAMPGYCRRVTDFDREEAAKTRCGKGMSTLKEGYTHVVDADLKRYFDSMRKQEKRPGGGRCLADHKRWPNAYFAGLGLFTVTRASTSASQSR